MAINVNMQPSILAPDYTRKSYDAFYYTYQWRRVNPITGRAHSIKIPVINRGEVWSATFTGRYMGEALSIEMETDMGKAGLMSELDEAIRRHVKMVDYKSSESATAVSRSF